MGYNFSAPIFISPATRAAYGDPDRAELNFVDAAASENILYVVSFCSTGKTRGTARRKLTSLKAAIYASLTIEEIQAQKHNDTLNGGQVIFQQVG